MTAHLACEACGRELSADIAFCPYCGAGRRRCAADAPSPAPPDPVAAPLAQPRPDPPPASAVPLAGAPEAAPGGSAPSEPLPPPPPAAAPESAAPAKPRRKGGCGPRLLLLLIVVASVLAWCAVRGGRSAGAPPPLPGAVASRPLHLSRRWRTVRLPGDAPADARFALSTDTEGRVRAAGRTYALHPGRPLRLPEDVGESFDLRAADYVSAQEAAAAQVTLSTLRGGA